MCGIDKCIILSETENGVISWCKCCRMFTLAYKSCCAVFDKRDLQQFGNLLNGLSPDDFHYNLNDHQQILLKKPGGMVGFCLTQREVNEVCAMLDEALTVNELFQLVYER